MTNSEDNPRFPSFRLILMRHAKSDWGSPTLPDMARPLNARGRRASRLMGRWMKDKGYLPDVVLCSPAERTRQTWQLLSQELGTAPPLVLERPLYHATAETMLDVLHGAAEEATVLMLGHNPGIAAMAQWLAHTAPPHPGFRRYPTAATTVFAFGIGNWAEAGWGTGKVLDFAIPKDLEG